MKVGMIFECGPKGADGKVCKHLTRLIDPDIQIKPEFLDDKKKLIDECGRFAAKLLAKGCDRVVIVWDLRPAWPDKNQKPCLKNDRKSILDSLKSAGADMTKVFLVCIEQELEAWLLVDERAINKVLSTDIRQIKINRVRNPEHIKNPKKHMDKIFRNHIGRRYDHLVHAKEITQAVTDLNRLRRVATFRRFACKVAGVKL